MSNRSVFGRTVHTLRVAIVGTVAGIALAVAGLFAASHAHADPFNVNDAAYLSTLHENGVVVPGHQDDAFLMQLGHAVCADLASGLNEVHEVYTLHSNGVSYTDAGTIVGAAEGAYCHGGRAA